MYDPGGDNWTELRKISNVSTDNYDDAYAIVRVATEWLRDERQSHVACGEMDPLQGLLGMHFSYRPLDKENGI